MSYEDEYDDSDEARFNRYVVDQHNKLMKKVSDYKRDPDLFKEEAPEIQQMLRNEGCSDRRLAAVDAETVAEARKRLLKSKQQERMRTVVKAGKAKGKPTERIAADILRAAGIVK
jgi:hypothetical protein